MSVCHSAKEAERVVLSVCLSVGSASLLRRIVNVADGTNDSDAAIVGQLNAAIGNIETNGST